MRIWLPYVHGGSGTDVFTQRLADALAARGQQVEMRAFNSRFQFCPCLLRRTTPPRDTDLIIANSWNAFAFARPGIPLVAINHLCVFDPALEPYKSSAQRLFHRGLVRPFEQWSYTAAAATVAVSRYSASQVENEFAGIRVRPILNGIDTDFFQPGPNDQGQPNGDLHILFVGNLSRRKGTDLLSPIMRRLGPGFQLHYASGLRTADRLEAAPNLHPLGRLDQTQMRNAYRRADAVLFPTRLEGFGYVAAEAMACGKPVLASRISSLPELITDGRDGLLCAVDDLDCFVDRLRALRADPKRRLALGRAARQTAEQRFSLARMADEYLELARELTSSGA